jgi:hypothetical protein
LFVHVREAQIHQNPKITAQRTLYRANSAHSSQCREHTSLAESIVDDAHSRIRAQQAKIKQIERIKPKIGVRDRNEADHRRHMHCREASNDNRENKIDNEQNYDH